MARSGVNLNPLAVVLGRFEPPSPVRVASPCSMTVRVYNFLPLYSAGLQFYSLSSRSPWAGKILSVSTRFKLEAVSVLSFRFYSSKSLSPFPLHKSNSSKHIVSLHSSFLDFTKKSVVYVVSDFLHFDIKVSLCIKKSDKNYKICYFCTLSNSKYL